MQLTTEAPPAPQHGPFAGPALTAALGCFVLLIAADAGFVIIHLLHKYSPLLPDRLYSLGQDGGYAEMFQYLKYYWVAILLGMLWSRTREPVYGAWMLLYAYLLCDDALRIHERGGAIVAGWGYQPALGLRAQDFGELTVSGAAGIIFLALICAGYLRSSRRARDISLDLGLLLGALVFFGVFLDMLHIILAGGRYFKAALGVIEDGGELFAMSATWWYVFALFERSGNAREPLWRTTLAVLSAVRAGRA